MITPSLPACGFRGRLVNGGSQCYCANPDVLDKTAGGRVSVLQCTPECANNGVVVQLSVAMPESRISGKKAFIGDGPGTILKRLLSRIGITANPSCACNSTAAEMDRQGPDWCDKNADMIIRVMRLEAKNRGLPFIEAGARLLLKRAIAKSRKIS